MQHWLVWHSAINMKVISSKFGRESIGHLNHIKDISEVQDVWPRPFNCLCHRGVAAKAGSVHLMFLMDRKLDQKGGARPYPHQHHPMLQGPPFSIKCTLATGSAQTIPQKEHTHTAVTTPKHTQCVHKNSPTPTHTTAHLTTYVGGATPSLHKFASISPSSSFLSTRWPHH